MPYQILVSVFFHCQNNYDTEQYLELDSLNLIPTRIRAHDYYHQVCRLLSKFAIPGQVVETKMTYDLSQGTVPMMLDQCRGARLNHKCLNPMYGLVEVPITGS